MKLFRTLLFFILLATAADASAERGRGAEEEAGGKHAGQNDNRDSSTGARDREAAGSPDRGQGHRGQREHGS